MILQISLDADEVFCVWILNPLCLLRRISASMSERKVIHRKKKIPIAVDEESMYEPDQDFQQMWEHLDDEYHLGVDPPPKFLTRRDLLEWLRRHPRSTDFLWHHRTAPAIDDIGSRMDLLHPRPMNLPMLLDHLLPLLKPLFPVELACLIIRYAVEDHIVPPRLRLVSVEDLTDEPRYIWLHDQHTIQQVVQYLNELGRKPFGYSRLVYCRHVLRATRTIGEEEQRLSRRLDMEMLFLLPGQLYHSDTDNFKLVTRHAERHGSIDADRKQGAKVVYLNLMPEGCQFQNLHQEEVALVLSHPLLGSRVRHHTEETIETDYSDLLIVYQLLVQTGLSPTLFRCR